VRAPRARGALPPVAIVWLLISSVGALGSPSGETAPSSMPDPGHSPLGTSPPTPVANLTAALQRTVALLALSGSGLLAVVWTRVALSWFSNDVAKKVQAKDRARDALIGTVIFLAAVSGLLWGVAHWVVTGT
jgi:hypothetical protein